MHLPHSKLWHFGMIKHVIPVIDQRHQTLLPPSPGMPVQLSGNQFDLLARPLHDLRISVTDRCNFRCSYCMPKDVFDAQYRYLPHADLLSFEEITRLARLFVSLGVRKIRLTGGEPLLRKNLEVLIAQLSELRTSDNQPIDLTLTTNGSLLARKAKLLKQAGLQRVTISLDALDDAIFRQMNDVDFPLASVLEGIDAAKSAGLGIDQQGLPANIKINMVVKRSTNADQILPMARHFRGTGMALRFIEYMDVGNTNGWRMNDVLPSNEVLEMLKSEFNLVRLEPKAAGETAQRWGWADSSGTHDPCLGEIGFISSVTQAFCETCNRARLSTEGKLFLCLFANQGYDLRQLLRQGSSDDELAATLAGIWHQRSDRYSQLRQQLADHHLPRVEMSYIGG